MTSWVRYVDGKFYLSCRPPGGGLITRRLTRWEVLLWRLFARKPKP